MATKIRVLGDTIKIDRAFVSGKDRIAFNAHVVFEGKFIPEEPLTWIAGNREYVIKSEVASAFSGSRLYLLRVYEQGQQMHSGLYNQEGKSLKNRRQAAAISAVHVCGAVGAAIGAATMILLNVYTGVVPGGATGGAIGGGCGGAIGYGFGHLLLRQRRS